MGPKLLSIYINCWMLYLPICIYTANSKHISDDISLTADVDILHPPDNLSLNSSLHPDMVH